MWGGARILRRGRVCCLPRLIYYHIFYLFCSTNRNLEKRNEILKLDIEVPDKEVEKEIARTRNYLKRYRNLNEAIRLLIQTSKFLETRRLITDILFNKEPCITLSRLDDGGLCVQYLKETDSLCVKILVGWRIDRDMNTNTIIDVIEVFYNNFNLPNASVIKNILTSLTHPTLDFHKKLKLWKLLIGCLQGKQTSLARTQSRRVVRSTSDADNIIVISDSTSTVTDNEQASSIKEANVICTSGIEVQTIDLDSSEADGVIVIPDCREETCPSPRKKRRVAGAQADQEADSTTVVVID
ncbi:unnamed protein product [Acanthoscelides obtectus]|uniref:Uncharacterized protein n=1 Tax=Acanthoscelides obtectus TaxID=200917 RepID=A0A9P0Q525_ACAOB|nr:unnamed protein product [Acanthoscelides obtectus]CAK1673245.1 hypothetical protein AOBTE_LOCUS29275 [Acanthoscelides obtectus]